MDAFKVTGNSPTQSAQARTIEVFELLKRQGFVSVRIGAIADNYRSIFEKDILNAASRLGLTVQSIAGSLWVRL